ncbi:helix-turn-helix transcriptional regulator [bacterium]|nr:helix-turn-helix transcriptional regulator [bacterium]
MRNIFREELGKNIRNLRHKKNITQETLSLEAHISRSHIAMLETGKRDITVSLLFQISRALNVNMREIFSFDDIEKYKFDVEKFYQ